MVINKEMLLKGIDMLRLEPADDKIKNSLHKAGNRMLDAVVTVIGAIKEEPDYEQGFNDGYQAGTEDAMEQKVVCDNCQFYRTDSGRSYCCLHHSTMRPDGYCSLGVKSGENNN